MFCPTCGRDSQLERKFCAACGTNLEAVSQVLFGDRSDFFTRLDTGLDQFIARYSEHVFKDAPSNATDRSVANSWKLLGKGVATSFVDLFLALFIWNVFTLRFQILWISTPFRLLAERSKRLKNSRAVIDTDAPLRMPDNSPNKWLSAAAPSVGEHTTERLKEYQPAPRENSADRES
jgi:hypothetical protein